MTGELLDDTIPRYAILSHTWGDRSQEVTFEDMMNCSGRGKAGYRKIEFCAEQAARDGLRYFWVDTCCIDKSSAAELSENINSMFRWYKNAIKCYVYLTDVSTPSSEDDRDSQLHRSRWFTRSWTLQELIAPQYVEFFCREHLRIGDKKSLEQQLHQITRISIYALRGELLSRFSVAERLSWVQTRSATRKEDMAYSLLGIFDISMPAIYGEGERNAFRRLRDEIDRYSRNHLLDASLQFQSISPAEQQRAAENPPKWLVPLERNPHFTGRGWELSWLEEKLFGENRTPKLAITGLGGVGKTQLVLELLLRISDKLKNCLIIWITATNLESLHQSYVDVAVQLQIPGSENEKADVKRVVQEHLSKEDVGQWLLVFDNADDIEMWTAKSGSTEGTSRNTQLQCRHLFEYVPRSKQGSVIFTTRDKKTAAKLAPHSVMEVQELSEEAAMELLKSYLHDHDLAKQRRDAVSLVGELTYLPLAIVQAAAYISQTGITLSDYLSLLSGQEEEAVELLSQDFEDNTRYRDVKNPVVTTWLISFEQIQRRDALAVEYLSFMACIEPKNIPQSLLPPATTRKRLFDALGVLNAYSFVTRTSASSDSVLKLHRLVHLAMRNWLSENGKLNQCFSQAVQHLANIFPIDKHENRSLWRSYLPHAIYAMVSTKTHRNIKGRVALLEKVGMSLHRDGRYAEGRHALEEVMEIRKQELGIRHPDTLRSMNGLASVLRRQGKYKAAERMSLQALEERKTLLGFEHPDTLFSMNSSAIVMQEQGKFDVAEQMIRQALEIRKRILGVEHRDSLFSMNSLAIVLRKLGKYEVAEDMVQKALKGRTKMLGIAHPETLSSMSHLSVILRLQRKYEAAEEMCRQVLERRENTLGVEHPDTMISMSALAVVLQDQKRFEEAKGLCQRALEGREKKLGAEHPDTLESIFLLATLTPLG